MLQKGIFQTRPKASRALTDCLAKHDFDDSCCELERRFLEAIKKGLRQ